MYSLKNLFETIVPNLTQIKEFKDVSSLSNSINENSNLIIKKKEKLKLTDPHVFGQISRIKNYPKWIKNFLNNNESIRIGVYHYLKEEYKVMEDENRPRLIINHKDLSFISCIACFLYPWLIFAEEATQKLLYEELMAVLQIKFSSNYQIDRDKKKKNIKKIRNANDNLFESMKNGKITKEIIKFVINILEFNLVIIDLDEEKFELHYPYSRLYTNFDIFKNLCILMRCKSSSIDNQDHYDLVVPDIILNNRENLSKIKYHFNDLNSQINIPENPDTQTIQMYNKYPLATELAYTINKLNNPNYKETFSYKSNKSHDQSYFHVYQLNSVLDYWLSIYINILKIEYLRNEIIMFRWEVLYFCELFQTEKINSDDFLTIVFLHFKNSYSLLSL